MSGAPDRRSTFLARILAPVLVAAACCAAAAWPAARARQADSARIYVTVLDANDRPVRGLTAPDFTVTEDGAPKTIERVEGATDPLALDLMTDRLGGNTGASPVSPDDMRKCVAAIADLVLAVLPDSQVSLVTFDGAAVQAVKYTSSRVELDAKISKLYGTTQTDVLLEAIVDASRRLSARKTTRRVIAAVVGGYKADQSSVLPAFAMEELRKSGAALWMLEMIPGAAGVSASPNRDLMATTATRLSGGITDVIGASTALPGAGQKLAVAMLAQYAVDYAAPAAGGDAKIEVGINRAGLHVLAPRWTSAK